MKLERSVYVKVLIGLASVILIALIGIIVYLTFSNGSKKQLNNNRLPGNSIQNNLSKNGGLFDSSSSTTKLNALPSPIYKTLKSLPRVKFEAHKNQAIFPQTPKILNSYLLKTTFNQIDITNIQAKFGLDKTKLSNDNTILYSDITKEILAINRTNGSFIFESLNDSQVLNGTTKRYGSYILKDQAGLFLDDIGLDNQTISCPISYSKTGYEGYTFIECHRDWSKVGLPILNPVGLLSIPENVSLQSLALGKVDLYFEKDPTIYNVSDGENFKKRPDDFNTATFIFDADHHLVAAKSNLLFLSKPTSILGDLLYPSEALKQFMAHKSAYSMASVTGEGIVDPQIAFPSGTADSKLGVITDFILAYLQNPLTSQVELSPMYVIRGYSQLDSGFRSSFIEVIPAAKTANLTQVLGVSSQNAQVLGEATDADAVVTGQNLLSLSCLKNTGATSSTAIVSGVNKTETVSGEGFPPSGQNIIIVACIKKPDETMELSKNCTSGNPQLDATWGLSLNPGFTFSVSGQNPVTTTVNGNIEPLTVTTFTDQKKVNIFFYGAVPNSPTGPGKGAAQQQAEVVFLSLQKYCANIKWNDCQPSATQPSEDQLTNVIRLADGAKIGTWRKPPGVGGAENSMVWYYVPAPGVQLTENELYSKILAIRNRFTTAGGLRPRDRIIGEFNSIGLCPIRITGNSPTIFAYGKVGTAFSIIPQFKLIYTDTSRDINGSWNIKFKKNKSLDINSNNRQYLYYEYDQQKFDVSAYGWNLTKDKITELVQEIGVKLQLLSEEKKRLQFEFQQATRNIDDQSNFSVTLIPHTEINTKLPLKIDPKPDNFYRFHFLINPNHNSIKSQPTLLPIKRNGLTVIEFGAATQY